MDHPKHSSPPQWPLRFFRWFCHPDIREDIEGDLLERFDDRVQQFGTSRARRLFIKDVFSLIRPGIVRPESFSHPIITNLMLRNNLKIAWRTLFKNRSYSLINIGGLATGMLVPILIGLWMYSEISYNKQFENHDRISMVLQNQNFNGEIETWTGQALQLEPALRNDFADYFDHIITATGTWDLLLSYEDKKISKSGSYMGPEILEMLSANMIQGDRKILEDPGAVALSASTAAALFGKEDPMGKGILINNERAVSVQGIYEDFPENSSFGSLDLIAPWELHVQSANLLERVEWGNSWFRVYVQLAENADLDRVSEAIKFVKRDNIEEEYATRTKPELHLHPMQDWYLRSDFENGVVVGGRIEYVRLFGIIAIFVLLLACINFMNLSTARSEKRAKEVGIRKTLGSLRRYLIAQFFSESLLVAILSFLVALILVILLLPSFNEISGKDLSIMWSNPWFWMAGLGFTLFTGLLAGSYPALFLSAFRPIKALKGSFRTGRMASLPRKVLVVIQFTVSISLIIGTVFIFRQIQHAKDRPIGYNRDNLLYIPINDDEIVTHFQALRDDLMSINGIEEMAGSDVPVTATYVTNGGFDWTGKDPNMGDNFTTLRHTQEFGKMVEWEILEGRDFSKEMATDSACFILNEAAVAYMGLENPVGELVKWGDNGDYKVIGVVKNLVTQSPYDPVRQTIFVLHNTWLNYVNIKLKPDSKAHETLAQIEKVFKKYDPQNPFEYTFADQSFARKFRNEERVGSLASFFAALAIFISCLGLFGLASYMAERRTKEIGIRKVLGASVLHLWNMLSKDFIYLVLLSCLLAAPITYLLMNNWLEDFSYRTELSWWVFVTVGALAMLITIFTVSFQALRAAWKSPVDAIGSE